MRLVIGTLCLNEIEHLPKLYEQHKHWPGLTAWVFVEAADLIYAQANPKLVSKQGLSVDGTTKFLMDLAASDPRVIYIPYGFVGHDDPAQGKCKARQEYLMAADDLFLQPDLLVVLDADEFYSYKAQYQIPDIVQRHEEYDAFCFRHRDIWRPHSIKHEPLFQYEVTGGFWDIPYCRFWRWYPGLEYCSNHNTPERNGIGLDKKMLRFDEQPPGTCPECVHLAFASRPHYRAAKHKYYIARGEGRTDRRGWYVESRAAFERWSVGKRLPHGGKVIRYNGPIPECFEELQVR